MKRYLIFLAPMLALATISASAQPAAPTHHVKAPWKFDCTAKACPNPMPDHHYVGLDTDTGKWQECHGYTSDCRDIPKQGEPGCRPAKGHTWYQTCVQPFTAGKMVLNDSDLLSGCDPHVGGCRVPIPWGHVCKVGFSWDEENEDCTHHFTDSYGNDRWTAQDGNGAGVSNPKGIVGPEPAAEAPTTITTGTIVSTGFIVPFDSDTHGCNYSFTWDEERGLCSIHVTFMGAGMGIVGCSPVSTDYDKTQHMICWYKPVVKSDAAPESRAK